MTVLGDLVTLQGGGTPARNVPAYWNGDIPWASVKDLNDSRLRSTEESISEAGVAASATNVIRAGHVIVATRMAVGRASLLEVDAAINQDLKALLPRPGKRVHPNYLLHLLGASAAFLEKRATGATVKGIRGEVLERLPVPHSDYEEQRHIADMLDKADAIRRKRKEAIALTEELLRSAFLEMFGDPVTNPKGWPVKALGEVVDLFAGNSLPSGVEFSGQCDGYLLMKVGDMNIPGNEVEVAVAREWAATVPSAAVIAPAGAVVIPKRGGAIATNKKRVLTRAAALDPNLMAIAPRVSLELEFLRQWFDGIDLAKLSNGSAVPQLNKKDLAPLTIPVPPSQRQMKFAEYAKSVRAMRAHAERGQAEADVLFSGLVARAFSGGLSA